MPCPYNHLDAKSRGSSPQNFGLKRETMRYVSFIHRDEAGYGVSFSDFPGCVSAADTVDAEFEYRFNRRFDLPEIIPRLACIALRTPPMPERLLKLNLA